MKNIILSLILLLSAATPALAMSTAEEADSAYNKEEYRQAVSLYEQAIREDGPSSVIYYNLGNAYFRTDSPGHAILNYERSLRMDPTAEDTRTNLEFVRSTIQGMPEDDSSFLSNLNDDIRHSLKPDTWAVAALVCFLLVLSAAALYIFSRSIVLRKVGFFGGGVLMLGFIFLIIVAWQSHSEVYDHSHAIVTVPNCHLSSSPKAGNSQDDKYVTLPEGSKVEIIDSINVYDDNVSPKWYNVKINNSTKAWLRASDVEKI